MLDALPANPCGARLLRGNSRVTRRELLRMFALPTYAFAASTWTAEQLLRQACATRPQPPPPPPPLPVPAAPLPVVHQSSCGSSDTSPHYAHVMRLPQADLDPLRDAYVCTYDVKVAYTSEQLQPTARAVLGDAVQVAAVFDAACARGIAVLGIAPAHRRNNKWTTSIPGDPPRVYVGPSKLPLHAASVFCAPPTARKR